jgi:hypothetical protein
MDPPPPPPPPHTEGTFNNNDNYRKASDLPNGKYDIFVIPPHSAGGGFLYLPSLQCHRNSFIAGVVCTLIVVLTWIIVLPVLKEWFAAVIQSGGMGVIFMVLLFGVGGWAWGKTQTENAGMGGMGSNGGPGPQQKPNYSTGPTPNGSAFPNGPPPNPPPQNAHTSSGHTPSGSAGGQSAPPPPKSSWQRATGAAGAGAGARAASGAARGGWEKAREEMRKKEEERRKAEELKKRREELERKRQERRETDAKERLERERKEKEAKEKETKEKEAKEKEAKEKEVKEAAARAASVSSSPKKPDPPRTPSPTKPRHQPATAKTEVTEDDAYSFRPYDRPKRTAYKTSASSVYSESSYAPSATTARTTPPPSHRGPYTTKDPDKIIIKAVYSFNNAFTRMPIAQLVSGQGSVTDGLILRITTEGLFIDDDVRGVPQREWDVKAWTLKLVEVWCPQFSATQGFKLQSKTLKRTGPSSVPSGEESDKFLEKLLPYCRFKCRLGSQSQTHSTSHASSAASSFYSASSQASEDETTSINDYGSATQSGELKGLHVLRATIRDQEGKKYVFILQESEGWKVAIGLQRLRRGTQVRALGVSGLPPNETKFLIENLGWG